MLIKKDEKIWKNFSFSTVQLFRKLISSLILLIHRKVCRTFSRFPRYSSIYILCKYTCIFYFWLRIYKYCTWSVDLSFSSLRLPRLFPRAIVRSVLSARWIQIVLRQQGYNPVDIKLAILDFAKFALLINREEPSSFSGGK